MNVAGPARRRRRPLGRAARRRRGDALADRQASRSRPPRPGRRLPRRRARVAEVAGLGIGTAVVPAGRLREPGGTLGAVRRLAALIRGRRPDLVLGWSAKSQLYAAPAVALARTGARLAWWQHDPRGPLGRPAATAFPARAIGCSSAAGRAPRRRCGRGGRPSSSAPASTSGRPGGAGLRERLGIPPGRTVVGIVGRLQPRKGQDRFLGALAELRRRGEDVHGLVVGGTAFDLSPGFAAELEALVARLGPRRPGDDDRPGRRRGRPTSASWTSPSAPRRSSRSGSSCWRRWRPKSRRRGRERRPAGDRRARRHRAARRRRQPGGARRGDRRAARGRGAAAGDGRGGGARCRERFSAEAMTAALTDRLTELSRG